MVFKFVTFSVFLAAVNAGGIVAPVTYAASPLFTKVVHPSVDAVASTQQNVVRSFGGTVSTYSKSVDTPYSSVRKTDTRINNNVYTPTVAKTVTYAAPASSAPVYAAHSPAIYAGHSPAVYAAPAHTQAVYAAPALAKAVYAAPAIAKTIYSQQAPVVHSYATPAITKTIYSQQTPDVYSYAPHATTETLYSQQSPVVYSHATPAVAKTISYAGPSANTAFNHGLAATTYNHNAPGVTGYGTSQTVHYSPSEMVSHMSFDGFGTHWGF